MGLGKRENIKKHTMVAEERALGNKSRLRPRKSSQGYQNCINLRITGPANLLIYFCPRFAQKIESGMIPVALEACVSVN